MKRHLSRADMNHLQQLGALKERGILTADEFAAEKAIMLNQKDRRAPMPVPSRSSLARPIWLASALALLILGAAIVGISSREPPAHASQNPSATTR